MSNDIETLKKIIDFFKEIGVKAQNITFEVNNLSEENNVLRRYLKVINKKNKQEKKIETNNNYAINSYSTFCVIYEDETFLNELKDILSENITFGQFNSFCIKSTQSELFLEIWDSYKDIVKWRSLSDERRFDWTYENINKGIKMDIWDWSELSKNPALPWSFEFVEKYKDYLQWKYVKVNNKLHWDESLIEKYSKYIFTSENINNRSELTFCKDLIDEWKVEFERNDNVNWTNSLIENYSEYWDWKSLSKNSKIIFDDYLIQKYQTKLDFKYLSGISNIKISSETIIEFKDLWDWEKLVRNKSVKLDFTILDLQKDVIDWNFIIIHPYLKWTKEHIGKFSNYIFDANTNIEKKKTYGSYLESYCNELNHTGYFESNQNIIWDDELINYYKDSLNWKYLSQNQSIFFNELQLQKYETYIDWDVFFANGNTKWDERVIDKYLSKSNVSNLVDNKFIIWNSSMFEKFIKNQPSYVISAFCRKAIILDDVIIKFQKLWRTIEISESHRFKFSDFGNYTEYTYHTLWEDLLRNDNIEWDDELIESCLENIVINEMLFFKGKISTNFMNKYWDFSKEENIWYVGNYDEGTYSKTSVVFLRDYFQYCEIVDLSLNKIIENEFKWLDSTLNNYTLHKSIERIILEECENRNIR